MLQVEDVPREWNARMKEYLGVEPDSDAQGCLQVRNSALPAACRTNARSAASLAKLLLLALRCTHHTPIFWHWL
jgi:Carboxypeptidase Taq (M32) metallopeptidase